MKSAEIKYRVSEDILNSLNQNKREFTDQSRLFTAMQLFKNHKISFGQAADIAGIKKEQLLIELDRYGLDFIDYAPSELTKELDRLSR